MVAAPQRRDHRCISDQLKSRPPRWKRQDLVGARTATTRAGAAGTATIAGGALVPEPGRPDHRRHRRRHRRPPRQGRDSRPHRLCAVRPGERVRRRRLLLRLAAVARRGIDRDDRLESSLDRQGMTIVLALVPALVIMLLVGSALHANFVSSWGLPLLISAAGSSSSSETPTTRSACGWTIL